MAQSGLLPLVARPYFTPQLCAASAAAPVVDAYLREASSALRHWRVLDTRVVVGLGILWGLPRAVSTVRGIVDWAGGV